MERLQSKIAWVVFTFKDGTKQTIETTLSKQIMNERGISPRENFLWDFNRNMYVPFCRDAINVEIFDEKPVFDREVLNFASRFI